MASFATNPVGRHICVWTKGTIFGPEGQKKFHITPNEPNPQPKIYPKVEKILGPF